MDIRGPSGTRAAVIRTDDDRAGCILTFSVILVVTMPLVISGPGFSNWTVRRTGWPLIGGSGFKTVTVGRKIEDVLQSVTDANTGTANKASRRSNILLLEVDDIFRP